MPPTLDRTVERREHASPDTEVATRYGRTGFDDGESADHTIALRGEERGSDDITVGLYRQVRTLGEFLAPLIPCQMVPPTAPMAKALPKSERITHGLCHRKMGGIWCDK